MNIFLQYRSKSLFDNLTNVFYSLTVSNNQVYSNDELDRWPVYSGELFRAFLFIDVIQSDNTVY